MDLRSFWRVITVAAMLTSVPAALAIMLDGNAVAGSVRVVVKIEGKEVSIPLEGVNVTVVQNTSISNTSRQDDGIFVLYVPSDSYKTFDLLFTKPNYCAAKRRNIINGEKHKKIEVVTLVPEREVANFSDDEKEKFFADSAEILEMSTQAGISDEARAQIKDAAVRNLTLLKQSVEYPGSQMARPNPILQQKLNKIIGSGD